MSILDVLKKDHDEVLKSLKQSDELIDKYPNINEDKLMKLVEKIFMLLEPHNKAEERVFYEALKEKDHDNLQPYEGVEEHHLAIQVLKELQKGSLEKGQLMAKMRVLKEALLHHIKEEETEYFKTAEQIFNSAELEEMGKRFIEKKEAVLKSKNL